VALVYGLKSFKIRDFAKFADILIPRYLRYITKCSGLICKLVLKNFKHNKNKNKVKYRALIEARTLIAAIVLWHEIKLLTKFEGNEMPSMHFFVISSHLLIF